MTALAVVMMIGLAPAEPAATVGFELVENHIYIPVRLQGQERRWILDTGAGATVIDRAFADELGLEAAGEVKAMGASGAIPAALVTAPGYTIGGLEQPAQAMVALDIATLLRGRSGVEVAGIVGADFLARYVVRVDYADSTVTLFPADGYEYRGDGRELELRRKMNIPSVLMTVEDSLTGWWRLDLGAAVSVMHHPAVAAHGLAERPGVELMAGGVGGMALNRLVRFGSAELAGYRVERPVLMVPLGPRQGALADPAYLGTLGASILRSFTLTLDYPGNRVFVEPGGGFGRALSFDRSGIQLTLAGSGVLRVEYVADGTPAAEAGLVPGDELLQADGRTVAEIGGLVPVRELLRAEAGTRRRLRVRRGAEELEFEFELRDLFD